MCWITLIVFTQTSSLRIKKLCCTSLKTTKQWSRLSLMEGVPQWDMFPGPTELRLIGYSIESIWTPRSKSNTLTTRTNSQTYWQREISHVMNGINHLLCLFNISHFSSTILLCHRSNVNCKEQDHTYRMSVSEYFQYRQIWWISLKKSGNTTEPVRKRSDFNQALSTLNR